jgi:hypothetical protein
LKAKIYMQAVLDLLKFPGVNGPGFESRWKRDFSHPSRPALEPPPPITTPSLQYNEYWVSFPGIKRAGRGFNHPPPSSAEVKERVELYLYFPAGHSSPVPGRTLPFTLSFKFWRLLCSSVLWHRAVWYRIQHECHHHLLEIRRGAPKLGMICGKRLVGHIVMENVLQVIILSWEHCHGKCTAGYNSIVRTLSWKMYCRL